MSPPGVKTAQKKKRPSEVTSYTVMIARGFGKVRSFNVSLRVFLWIAAVLALYLLFSGFAMSRYFDEVKSRTEQSDLLNRLQQEIQETKTALYRARQRLKFLEDYVGSPQGKGEGKSQPPESRMTNRLPAGAFDQEKSQQKAYKIEPAGAFVYIKDLTTKRTPGRFSVKFKLCRTKPNNLQATGYIFIIAANNASDPPHVWVHPKATLKEGIPVNHTEGQLFKVRNYRIIRGKYFLDPETKTPPQLRILVYDESGKLILDEAFETEKTS